jgi:UDP-glucose 4-epimerase
MKVLVTGGAGFIGSHIVDRLIAEGHEVVVLDNLSNGKKENLHPKAVFYKVDIRSPRVEKIFRNERPEMVSHHAAQMDVRRSVTDPVFDAEVNILGFLNILESAVKHGSRKVIFASSGGAIYGEQEVFPSPEDHPTRPVSPYGASKLAGEQYLFYYHAAHGLHYTALRYANVYGPRQDPFGEAGVVAIFTQKLLKGEQPVINGNGMQTRDYVFVGDVVDAQMAALYGEGSDYFNVGTGVETSVNELLSHLTSITGTAFKEVHGPAKKGEQKRSCLSYDKIKRLLDWEPRVTLRQGLEATVSYFRGPNG